MSLPVDEDRLKLKRTILERMVGSVCVCIFLLTCSLSGCTGLDFGGDVEHENLSYEQYVATIGTHPFDPKGASEIYYRGHSTRDGWDFWWRLAIDRASFDSLLAQMTANMDNPEYVSHDSQRVGPVRHSTSDDPEIPANWPRPDGPPPTWWQPPEDGEHLSCTRWELQVDNSPYNGRSRGWYWLYETDSATLWIWHWNHQHFDLGWSMGATDAADFFRTTTGFDLPESAEVIAAKDRHFEGEGLSAGEVFLVFDADPKALKTWLSGPAPWKSEWKQGPVPWDIAPAFGGDKGCEGVDGGPTRFFGNEHLLTLLESKAIQYAVRARADSEDGGELIAIDPDRGRVWVSKWDR